MPSIGIFESFSGRYAETSDPSPVPSPNESPLKPSVVDSHICPHPPSPNHPASKSSSPQHRVMVANSDSDPFSQKATDQEILQPGPSALPPPSSAPPSSPASMPASRGQQEDPFLASFTRASPTGTKPTRRSLDIRTRQRAVTDHLSPVGTVLGKRTRRDSAKFPKAQIRRLSSPPPVPTSASKEVPTIDLSKPAKTIHRQIAKQRKSQVREEYVARPMTWLDCGQIIANVILARTKQGVHSPEKV